MANVSRAGCCREPGCSRPIEAKRMCKAHYQRWYRVQRPEKQAALNAARRKSKTRRICPVDGTQFEAANNRRFCSQRCAKRAENAKRYGWDPSARPMPEPYNCENCGGPCVPGEGVPPQASRFCSPGCKREWHRIATALLESFTAEPRRKEDVAYRRAMRLDPCSYCGRPSQALDHIVPRCDGGPDDSSNRTPACHSCNSSKQSSPLLIYLAWRQARAAFEPWRAIVAEIHTRAPA